jgi:hypothetical protein
MKRIAIATLALLIAGALAVPAQAQSQTFGQAFGSLYLSAAPDQQIDYLQEITPGVQFEFYVVTEIDFSALGEPDQNNTNGIKGWEARVTVPASMFVLNQAADPVSVDLGDKTAPVFDYIVGTGQNVLASSTPRALVTFTGLFTAETGGTVLAEIGNVANPSADNPSWVEWLGINECFTPTGPTGCIREFTDFGNLRLSTGVDTDQDSWGGMKAQFGSE